MSATRDVLDQKGVDVARLADKIAKTGLFDRGALSKTPGTAEGAGALVSIDKLSLTELLELRADIDAALPPRALADLDLEEEVLLQFARTKALYDRISEDNTVPANQRAQVANSCTSILDQLIKMQARLYSAERVKSLEQVLIKVLKTLPEATQTDFFERYERALEDLAAASVKK